MRPDYQVREWRWEFEIPENVPEHVLTHYMRAGGAIVNAEQRAYRFGDLTEVISCKASTMARKARATQELGRLHAIDESTADPGHVYFVFAPELRRIKIGFTRDVARRFTSLRNSSPCDLLLIGSVRAAPVAEGAFHGLLQDFRRYGEWFDLTAEVGRTVLIVQAYGEEGAPWA